MDLGELVYGKDAPVTAVGISGAAPTAGTAIATLNGPALMFTAGAYDVAVVTRCHSTSPGDEVSGLEKNMEFRKGATVVRNQLNSTKQPGGVYYFTDIQLDGSTNFTVNATANASAGLFYQATIIAVRQA